MGKPSQLNVDVLENGLDFILHGIKILIENPAPRDLKYAVLSLYSGVVLILKRPLEQVHWSLVFSDVNRANLNDYRDFNFKSIGLDDCVKRLENICQIKIEKDDQVAIEYLGRKRNKLEHFGITDTFEALIGSIIPVLNFILDFINDNFPEDALSRDANKFILEIRKNISRIDELVTKRLEKIKIDEDALVITCPICMQFTLEIDDGGKCLFCGHSDTAEKIAADYVEKIEGYSWRDVKDGGVYPLFKCPECGCESFFELEDSLPSEEDGFICTSCGLRSESIYMDFCQMCGNPFIRDGSAICPDCMDFQIHKD